MLRGRGHLSSIMAASPEVADQLTLEFKDVIDSSVQLAEAVASFAEAAKARLQTDHNGDIRRHYLRFFRQVEGLVGQTFEAAIDELEKTPQVLEEQGTPQPRELRLRHCLSSLSGLNTRSPSNPRSPIRRRRDRSPSNPRSPIRRKRVSEATDPAETGISR